MLCLDGFRSSLVEDDLHSSNHFARRMFRYSDFVSVHTGDFDAQCAHLQASHYLRWRARRSPDGSCRGLRSAQQTNARPHQNEIRVDGESAAAIKCHAFVNAK